MNQLQYAVGTVQVQYTLIVRVGVALCQEIYICKSSNTRMKHTWEQQYTA